MTCLIMSSLAPEAYESASVRKRRVIKYQSLILIFIVGTKEFELESEGKVGALGSI